MSACQLVVAVAFVVVCVVVVAVSMQIQQTVTKCATLSALILDSDAHETRLSPAFHFIFHISFFFLHLLCCFLFFSLSLSLSFSAASCSQNFLAAFPSRQAVWEFFSASSTRRNQSESHATSVFFPHLCVPPFALPFCTCLPPLLYVCVCVFLHISHGGQVKNSVICSTASQLATNATRS